MARGTATTARRDARVQRTDQLLRQLKQTTDPALAQRLTDELVEANLGLCDALASRYLNRGAERDDLVQVARMALLLAIRRFEPAENRSFVAFAAPTIAGELKRHFRDRCWVVRPPRRIQELRAQASQRRSDLEQRLGRPVRPSELVAELGASRSQVDEAATAESSYRPWSLEASLDPAGENTLGATLADPDDAFERATDRLALQRMLAGLSRRDRAILIWRFDEGCTQDEIGHRLGISQMQVSRLIRRILADARAVLGAEPLAG